MFPIEPNFKPVKSSVIFACFFLTYSTSEYLEYAVFSMGQSIKATKQ